MSSFLDKLKKKNLLINEAEATKRAEEDFEESEVRAGAPPEDVVAGMSPLHIDLYRLPAEFVVYAQLPGVAAGDLSVFLEGEGDVLLIRAEQKDPHKPNGGEKESATKDKLQEKKSRWSRNKKQEEADKKKEKDQKEAEEERAGKRIVQECKWQKMYRRISLPAQVSSQGIRAELEEGILKVTLPILKTAQKKKIEVMEKHENKS